jgi:anti-anti-sigma factor
MNPDPNSGQIHYAISGNRAFLKLSGIIRYPLSKRLNLAVAKLFPRGEIRSVVVDLQAAEFIDSTCMGLLARVATCCLELTCERPVIVSTHPEVNRLLRSMGFDRVFVLVENPEAPAAGLADAASLAGSWCWTPTAPSAKSTTRTATSSKTSSTNWRVKLAAKTNLPEGVALLALRATRRRAEPT